MRQYGETVPTPAAPGPIVSATTGLGTGGGAGVQSQKAGNGWFDVDVFAGVLPAAAGSVALTFATPPVAYFLSGDEAFGPLTQATAGNVITVSWTAAHFVSGNSKPYKLQLEWNASF